MEPLLITARLRCGVVSDPWLPLDGILFYQLVKLAEGEGPIASLPGIGSPITGDRVRFRDLPLAIIRDGLERFYAACSFAEWGQPYQEGRDHWNKRLDVERYGSVLTEDTRRVDTGSGRYRSYHMPVFYRVAPFVRWWVVGDRAGVERLLAGVYGIGKKRSYGWGRVAEWRVENAREDRSVWWGGLPQRAVPASEANTTRLALALKPTLYGYYPPYYAPSAQTECYLPPALRVAR